MSGSAYSDLKALWHLESMGALRRGEQVVPKQMHFVLSDLCNQDCGFCSYRMSTGLSVSNFAGVGGERNPNRKMPTGKALEILEQAASMGLKSVLFTGGGEPTVHPDHLSIFARAREFGLETALNTNGVLLRSGWESVLSGMTWIRASIDAGSDETYSRVRNVPRGTFEKALGNLSKIVEACPETMVGAGFVVTLQNWREIYDGCEAAKAAGAAYMRVSAVLSTAGADYYRSSSLYEDIRREIHTAQETLGGDGFEVVNLFGERYSDLEQHSPEYKFCGYQQFVPYVGGDLKVYRCCSTAYSDHGEIGDLSEQSWLDWWGSDQRRAAYGEFDARTCGVCQFNGKNRAINYVVGEEPTHVNFV